MNPTLDAMETAGTDQFETAGARQALGKILGKEEARTIPPASPVAGRQVLPPVLPLDAGRASGPAPFASLAEHFAAIARSQRPSPQLMATAQGVGGAMPDEGGFLLSAQHAKELLGSAYEAAILAPLCDRWQTSKTSGDHHIPAIDETSRAAGSRWGGCRTYWQSQADELQGSKPKFKKLGMVPRKLTALAYTSNELASDSLLLDAHLRRAFRAEMSFALDEAIVSGAAGLPLGFLNAGALIAIDKETGQSAGTILAENIEKMWARLPLPCRRRAIWPVNEDVESLLPRISGIGAGTSANYQPAGANGNPWPTLYGRPVVAIEQASPLGEAGDISLADFSQYLILDGPMAEAVSIHVRFHTDEIAWRLIYHVDGQPIWKSPVTPANGSNLVRSPFVTLGERA